MKLKKIRKILVVKVILKKTQNLFIFLKQILKMTMILGVLEVIQNLILKLVVLVVIAIEV